MRFYHRVPLIPVTIVTTHVHRGVITMGTHAIVWTLIGMVRIVTIETESGQNGHIGVHASLSVINKPDLALAQLRLQWEQV